MRAREHHWQQGPTLHPDTLLERGEVWLPTNEVYLQPWHPETLRGEGRGPELSAAGSCQLPCLCPGAFSFGLGQSVVVRIDAWLQTVPDLPP